MLRPGTKIERIVDAFVKVVLRCRQEGVTPVLLAGADPSDGLPLSRVIRRRGDELTAAATARLRTDDDIVWAINWTDERLRNPSFWAPDRLHMNFRGHHRVAARVLDSLGNASRCLHRGIFRIPQRRTWARARSTVRTSLRG